MSEFKQILMRSMHDEITREMMRHDAATLSSVAFSLLVALIALLTVRYMYVNLTK